MTLKTTDLLRILDEAEAAALKAARDAWERDGCRDRGTCGGVVMILDGRFKVAKLAVEKGLAFKGSCDTDATVRSIVPEDVRSQNMDIPEASMRAFREVLIANGLGKAVKRFWTYID